MNGDSIRVWDVKNVVNSAGMFESAQWFKEDMIEKWDCSGVGNNKSCLPLTSGLLNIS